MDRDVKIGVLECVPVIQGEGRSTGTPMILIRIAGCNLNCMFHGSICDASETSWKHDNVKNKKWTLNEIKSTLRDNSHINHVMITGGQPTLNKALFKSILALCLEEHKKVEIEDNGTTFIDDLDPQSINLVSMSPKLSNSIPVAGIYIAELGREVTEYDQRRHEKNFCNIESMKSWIQNFDYQLKFVISDEHQIGEALSLAAKMGADFRKIYFMPEGSTKKQLESRRQWLYERCLQMGIKYTDRLHIIVYDNKKGV